MRRAIGIFLAFLIIPTTAFGKTPEKSSSDPPGRPHDIEPEKAGIRIGATGTRSCETARSREDPGDPYWGPTHTTGRSEYGKAAWYGLVGNHTSSGEMLDTVTATAAHRTLPLHSYAKVTNLDSGRSLIVKINDRGPYTRGRIIDLSPRAAEQLEVKQAGVVPVVVEPVAKGNELGPQRSAPNNRAAATPTAATPEMREARAGVSATKASPAPAWVDPRIEQPAPNNQAAATPAATPEVREARAEIAAAEAAPAPVWVDPRIEESAPNNQAAATPTAATAEVREARAEVRAAEASPAPVWVDPRIEQPAPNNQAAATPTATTPEVREARAEVRTAEASPAPTWVDPRIEEP
jgi:rare lipoprotein A (peptidoglycan hydrolase)